jgi:hypothetical protein
MILQIYNYYTLNYVIWIVITPKVKFTRWVNTNPSFLMIWVSYQYEKAIVSHIKCVFVKFSSQSFFDEMDSILKTGGVDACLLSRLSLMLSTFESSFDYSTYNKFVKLRNLSVTQQLLILCRDGYSIAFWAYHQWWGYSRAFLLVYLVAFA